MGEEERQKDLIGFIRGLSDDDRKSLAVMLGVRHDVVEVPPGAERDIYDMAVAEVAKYGRRWPPMEVVSKSPRFGRFARGAKTLAEFVAEHFGGERRASKSGATRSIVQLIVEQRAAKGWSLSVAGVGDGMADVEESVDRAFPGYIASGLLTCIVTRGHKNGRFRRAGTRRPPRSSAV